ncbi:MAG: tRNA (adenosine(37)-N6)-threonylcarbamoyltransferase complex ATPase subunit type 1 TsaE [Desulfobacterales bacterium]|nr:tRNA (adenosine(37)-N6)-threonylcarbamoyltransferase complex ATPase subunit type 1 TsaE [Desulfobacterales bacterium]
MKQIVSTQADDTQELGRKLGEYISTLSHGCSMALTGDLGTGKTCFVQGLAQGLKVEDGYYITSPTFNIMNEYPAKGKRLCHLDLYRLSDVEELDYLGIEDRLGQDAVVAVEWPALLAETGFEFDLEIDFKFNEKFHRVISFLPSGQHGSNLLSNLIL